MRHHITPPWLLHGLPVALGVLASTLARPIYCEFFLFFHATSRSRHSLELGIKSKSLTSLAQWNHNKPTPSSRWTLWYNDFPASPDRFFIRHGSLAAPAARKPFRRNHDPDSRCATTATDRRSLRPDCHHRPASTDYGRVVWRSNCSAPAAAATATDDRRRIVRRHSSDSTGTNRRSLWRINTGTAHAKWGFVWRNNDTAAAPGDDRRTLRDPSCKHRQYVWEAGDDYNGGWPLVSFDSAFIITDLN